MEVQNLTDNLEAQIAGFISKTYEILNSDDYSKVIHWTQSGKQFAIKDINKFQQIVLPQFFRHKKINSFIRQLNMYGFHKSRKDNSKCIFSHPSFLRGREDLLVSIKRKIKQVEAVDKTPQKQAQAHDQEKRIELTCIKQIKDDKKLIEDGNCNLGGLIESRNFISSFVNLNISLRKLSINNFDNLQSKQDDEVSLQDEIQLNQKHNIINPSFFFCSFNELNLT